MSAFERISYRIVSYRIVQASEAAAGKTPACKSAADAETAASRAEDETDDNAPTPKHWSSDWDPTLNSLLSAYAHYFARCAAVS